ncbi:hypothetical protein HOK51_02975 [Candidatus Woesearchaeota archaeon]|nr:hypothetical protein [Candidatus Woesearchaeota archaeon]MBT7368361.1 hypothetical protein [Candidatus Woesearchaeota archaeon]
MVLILMIILGSVFVLGKIDQAEVDALNDLVPAPLIMSGDEGLDVCEIHGLFNFNEPPKYTSTSTLINYVDSSSVAPVENFLEDLVAAGYEGKVYVHAYASIEGKNSYNQDLSDRRAEAVTQILAKTMIDKNAQFEIVDVSHGETTQFFEIPDPILKANVDAGGATSGAILTQLENIDALSLNRRFIISTTANPKVIGNANLYKFFSRGCPMNEAPNIVLIDPPGTLPAQIKIDSLGPMEILVRADDPDLLKGNVAEALLFSISGTTPPGMKLEQAGTDEARLVWDSSDLGLEETSAQYVFQVTVEDIAGNKDSETITIIYGEEPILPDEPEPEPVTENNPPKITQIVPPGFMPALIDVEDKTQKIEITVLAEDLDLPEDMLVFKLIGEPEGMELTSILEDQVTIVWTPGADFDQEVIEFTINVEDITGAKDGEKITITFTDPAENIEPVPPTPTPIVVTGIECDDNKEGYFFENDVYFVDSGKDWEDDILPVVENLENPGLNVPGAEGRQLEGKTEDGQYFYYEGSQVVCVSDISSDCFCPTANSINWVGQYFGAKGNILNWCDYNWFVRFLLCWLLPLLLLLILFPIFYKRKTINKTIKDMGKQQAEKVENGQDLIVFLKKLKGKKEEVIKKIDSMNEKIEKLTSEERTELAGAFQEIIAKGHSLKTDDEVKEIMTRVETAVGKQGGKSFRDIIEDKTYTEETIKEHLKEFGLDEDNASKLAMVLISYKKKHKTNYDVDQLTDVAKEVFNQEHLDALAKVNEDLRKILEDYVALADLLIELDGYEETIEVIIEKYKNGEFKVCNALIDYEDGQGNKKRMRKRDAILILFTDLLKIIKEIRKEIKQFIEKIEAETREGGILLSGITNMMTREDEEDTRTWYKKFHDMRNLRAARYGTREVGKGGTRRWEPDFGARKPTHLVDKLITYPAKGDIWPGREEKVQSMRYLKTLSDKLAQEVKVSGGAVLIPLRNNVRVEQTILEKLITVLSQKRKPPIPQIQIPELPKTVKTIEEAYELIDKPTFKAKIIQEGCPPYKHYWVWGVKSGNEIRIPVTDWRVNEKDSHGQEGLSMDMELSMKELISAVKTKFPDLTLDSPEIILDRRFSQEEKGKKFTFGIYVEDDEKQTGKDERTLTITKIVDPPKVKLNVEVYYNENGKLKPIKNARVWVTDKEVDRKDRHGKLIELKTNGNGKCTFEGRCDQTIAYAETKIEETLIVRNHFEQGDPQEKISLPPPLERTVKIYFTKPITVDPPPPPPLSKLKENLKQIDELYTLIKDNQGESRLRKVKEELKAVIREVNQLGIGDNGERGGNNNTVRKAFERNYENGYSLSPKANKEGVGFFYGRLFFDGKTGRHPDEMDLVPIRQFIFGSPSEEEYARNEIFDMVTDKEWNELKEALTNKEFPKNKKERILKKFSYTGWRGISGKKNLMPRIYKGQKVTVDDLKAHFLKVAGVGVGGLMTLLFGAKEYEKYFPEMKAVLDEKLGLARNQKEVLEKFVLKVDHAMKYEKDPVILKALQTIYKDAYNLVEHITDLIMPELIRIRKKMTMFTEFIEQSHDLKERLDQKGPFSSKYQDQLKEFENKLHEYAQEVPVLKEIVDYMHGIKHSSESWSDWNKAITHFSNELEKFLIVVRQEHKATDEAISEWLAQAIATNARLHEAYRLIESKSGVNVKPAEVKEPDVKRAV